MWDPRLLIAMYRDTFTLLLLSILDLVFRLKKIRMKLIFLYKKYKYEMYYEGRKCSVFTEYVIGI
jgi:hypothetical protein